MVSIPRINPNMASMSRGLTKAGGLGIGALVTGLFCIQDFSKVPEAFKLDYNRKAQKVKGLNWGSGILEILKSALKCGQCFVLPALVAWLCKTATVGPLFATISTILAFAAPMLGYNVLDKLLPHEKQAVELACAKKGVDITKEAVTDPIKADSKSIDYLA